MKGFDIMKQVIPFQKELLFKTKVSEVTSISLEHFIDNIDNTVISGKFLVTGDYKMTEGSINREKFSFDIPFEISLDALMIVIVLKWILIIFIMKLLIMKY